MPNRKCGRPCSASELDDAIEFLRADGHNPTLAEVRSLGLAVCQSRFAKALVRSRKVFASEPDPPEDFKAGVERRWAEVRAEKDAIIAAGQKVRGAYKVFACGDELKPTVRHVSPEVSYDEYNAPFRASGGWGHRNGGEKQ